MISLPQLTAGGFKVFLSQRLKESLELKNQLLLTNSSKILVKAKPQTRLHHSTTTAAAADAQPFKFNFSRVIHIALQNYYIPLFLLYINYICIIVFE
jgi:hypothetical protein